MNHNKKINNIILKQVINITVILLDIILNKIQNIIHKNNVNKSCK